MLNFELDLFTSLFIFKRRTVYSLVVEEDVGLLVENRPDVADRHRGVVHLVPLTIARLGDNRGTSSFKSVLQNDLRKHSVIFRLRYEI